MRALLCIVGVCLVFSGAESSARAKDDKEVDITGHYTWKGIQEGEDYAIIKNAEVYQVWQRGRQSEKS